MKNEGMKFLKSKYELQKTPYIFMVGTLTGSMISRFNTLYFKVVETDEYFIIELIN